MKSKDQTILENLYGGINKNQNSKDVFSLIASDLNERSNPSDQIFEYLDEVKKTSSISELVSYLNVNKYWEAKDKLIKLLFSYYTPSGKMQ